MAFLELHMKLRTTFITVVHQGFLLQYTLLIYTGYCIHPCNLKQVLHVYGSQRKHSIYTLVDLWQCPVKSSKDTASANGIDTTLGTFTQENSRQSHISPDGYLAHAHLNSEY